MLTLVVLCRLPGRERRVSATRHSVHKPGEIAPICAVGCSILTSLVLFCHTPAYACPVEHVFPYRLLSCEECGPPPACPEPSFSTASRTLVARAGPACWWMFAGRRPAEGRSWHRVRVPQCFPGAGAACLHDHVWPSRSAEQNRFALFLLRAFLRHLYRP